jgi:hypothetical protein
MSPIWWTPALRGVSVRDLASARAASTAATIGVNGVINNP